MGNKFVIGWHKKCCLVIGYNVSNIVTNQICIHGRFQYTRKAFKWHNRNCGAGIKTINQTFGPRGVLARYRNICQLQHLGRAKCKHIPWGVQVCTNWFLIILTNITTQAELCSQPNSSPMLSLSSSVSANCHGMRQLTWSGLKILWQVLRVMQNNVEWGNKILCLK